MSLSDYAGADLDLRVLNGGSRDDLAAAPPGQSIIVVTGAQGHANSSLGKAIDGKSDFLKLDKDKDIIVFGTPSFSGGIGWHEKFLSDLREQGFTVVTKDELPLYSAARTRLPELIDMVKLTNPKYVLPIHGSAHLREAAAVAVSKMGRKAIPANNGDVLSVSRNGVKSTNPSTKKAPPLIGLKTLQGTGRDGWKDRYYLEVKTPQKIPVIAAPANNNKKHRPQIFNLN